MSKRLAACISYVNGKMATCRGKDEESNTLKPPGTYSFILRHLERTHSCPRSCSLSPVPQVAWPCSASWPSLPFPPPRARTSSRSLTRASVACSSRRNSLYTISEVINTTMSGLVFVSVSVFLQSLAPLIIIGPFIGLVKALSWIGRARCLLLLALSWPVSLPSRAVAASLISSVEFRRRFSLQEKEIK